LDRLAGVLLATLHLLAASTAKSLQLPASVISVSWIISFMLLFPIIPELPAEF
jgi:type II secretory pathway component PulF